MSLGVRRCPRRLRLDQRLLAQHPGGISRCGHIRRHRPARHVHGVIGIERDIGKHADTGTASLIVRIARTSDCRGERLAPILGAQLAAACSEQRHTGNPQRSRLSGARRDILDGQRDTPGSAAIGSRRRRQRRTEARSSRPASERSRRNMRRLHAAARVRAKAERGILTHCRPFAGSHRRRASVHPETSGVSSACQHPNSAPLP